MFDVRLRPVSARLLGPLAERLVGRVSATGLTLAAVVVGLGAAVCAWQQLPAAAVTAWLLARLLDGLDGAVARVSGSAGDAGGYADLVGDVVVYAAIPIGIAAGTTDDTLWPITAVLLATFYVNAVSWLMLSAVLEKRSAGAAARGELTSVTMPPALVEGTETIVFFTVALAVPSIAGPVFAVMAVAVAVGVGQRALAARQLLRR